MPDRILSTYDPESNPLASHEENTLPQELIHAIAGESADDQKEIVVQYRKAIRMPRRIDFLFGMSFMPTACLMQELFGQSRGIGDPTGADHYGVLNTYAYQKGRC